MKNIFFVLCIVFIGMRVHAIATDRLLFGDGAVFFLNMVSMNGVEEPTFVANDGKHMRLYVNKVTQSLAIGAVQYGVTDVKTLKVLYGIGLFFISSLGWIWAVFTLRRGGFGLYSTLPLLHYFLFIMVSDIFIINQSITAIGWYWVLLAYCISPIRVRLLDACIIAITGVGILKAHETILVVGPIIAMTAAVQGYKDTNKRWVCSIIALMSMVAAYHAYDWQYTHEVHSQTTAYKDTMKKVLGIHSWIKPPWSFSIWMMIGSLYGLMLWGKTMLGKTITQRQVQVSYRVVWGAIVLVVLQAVIYQVLSYHIKPMFEYQCRVLITLGSAGFMGIVLLGMIVKERLSCPIWLKRQYIIVFLALGFVQTGWQIMNTVRWTEYTTRMTKALSASKTPLLNPLDVGLIDTHVNPNNAFQEFSWTWPVLGVTLTDSGYIDKLFMPSSLTYLLKVAPNEAPEMPFALVRQDKIFHYAIEAQYP
jgi:hypothetical protein